MYWLQTVNNELSDLKSVVVWIENCTQIDVIKRVRQVAMAAESEIKEASTVRLHAERRLGQILGETLPHEGGRPNKETLQNFEGFSLKDLGLTWNQSSWFQTIAGIPEADFDAILERFQAAGRVPKASGIARDWKAQQKALAATSRATFIQNTENGLFTNDLGLLVSKIARGELEPYGCVYADPPWEYQNRGTRGAAAKHYPTMPLADLMSLPVEKLVAEKALLWLWVTDAYHESSFDLMRAWGFEYKAYLVWHKQRMGIGNYIRRSTELCLLASRGGQRTLKRNTDSLVSVKRDRHSEKPEAVRRIVEANSPQPRLELFGRSTRSGWSVFGNEDSGEQYEWKILN